MTTFSFPFGILPYTPTAVPNAYDPKFFKTNLGLISRDIPFALGLLSIALVDDATITFDSQLNGQPIYAGQSGFFQVIQDGTGGWIPTYTNATATDGIIPPPSSGPFDATMYQWVYDGSLFVLSLFAERYANAGSDSALALAQTRIVSALLPLPRVEVLVPGYALVFA